jgi:hypothetical protein
MNIDQKFRCKINATKVMINREGASIGKEMMKGL